MSTSSVQWKLLQQLLPRASTRCLLHHTAASRSLPPTTTTRIPQPPPRHFSTTPRQHQEAPPPTSQAPPSPEPSQPAPPRRRLRLFSAAILLLIGAIGGTAFRVVISPPPPLPLGSAADEAMKAEIRALAEQLPIVKRLKAEPGWTHHEAYSVFPAPSRSSRLTTGPLASSSAIGAYQHIFHPPPSSSAASSSSSLPITDVLYLGPSTTGWPGVVHGGLLSIILDEHSARAALAEVGGGRGVLTANLDIAYKRPTLAGGFYVAKARALREDELAPQEQGKRSRKVWVDVWLETPEGVECVRGRALFVIPKGRVLKGLEKGF